MIRVIIAELIHDDTTAPVWDTVGMRSCDFRPHFDGDLVNIFSTIYPLESRSDTESKFKDIAVAIADWILDNKTRFSAGDRFQIIVGWPQDVRQTGRQVIKTGGTFADIKRLANDRNLFGMHGAWDDGVFDA